MLYLDCAHKGCTSFVQNATLLRLTHLVELRHVCWRQHHRHLGVLVLHLDANLGATHHLPSVQDKREDRFNTLRSARGLVG